MNNDITAVFDKLIGISALAYLLAMIFYIFYISFRNKKTGNIATFIGLTGLIVQSGAFLYRWYSTFSNTELGIIKSVPITNLYEALLFFAMLVALFYIVFEFKSNNKYLGAFAFAVSGIMILFINTIGISSSINPLVPALQSNWLLAHVSLSFIAYVCFTIAAITAMMFLMLVCKHKKSAAYIVWTAIFGIFTVIIIALLYDVIVISLGLGEYRLYLKGIDKSIFGVKVIFALLTLISIALSWNYGLKIRKKFLSINLSVKNLNIITYKFIAAGFAIFTIGGLVFGAVWAEQAWGRYWSWDPKETWAFITWCVYGVYLHGRLYGKWNHTIANTIALIGFIITIFTFLGVNIIMSGLHSYGSIG